MSKIIIYIYYAGTNEILENFSGELLTDYLISDNNLMVVYGQKTYSYYNMPFVIVNEK